MGLVMIGALGAFAGLAIALLANILVLPWVLRQQASRVRRRSLGTPQLTRLIKLVYRILMPIVFAVVGAVGAVTTFGGSE